MRIPGLLDKVLPMKFASWLFISALLVSVARGYIVGPPMGLEDLAAKADVIFQGTAVSTNAVDDPTFQPVSGYRVVETDFQPAYASKGNVPASEIKFRYYAHDPKSMGEMYEPQIYEFEIGKSYLVFAKQPPGSAAGMCRQIWDSHTGMEDEGVLLCFRPEPIGRGSIKDLFWRDLTELLKSSDPKEVVYAIDHLDKFSASAIGPMFAFRGLSEFQRLDVLTAVHGFMANPDPTIAQMALTVIGSHNPYLMRERAQYWLATVGGADTHGLSKMDAKMVNVGGAIYWRDIAAIVDGKGDDATRALAIGALGLVREPSLQDSVVRWLGDPSPAVRAAAVLLLADYPALATHERLASLAASPDIETRISAAFAIGFAQNNDATDILGNHLYDPEARVRQAVAMSLLSFAPKDARLAKIFHDNLTNNEFAPLFRVAICQADPAANLDLLILETTEKSDPTNWPGGQIPAYTTSHLLFRFLVTQPADDLKSGRYDRALDALEIWKPNYSVDPQFVYALEIKKGLTDRAKKFRAAVNKASTYDVETYFQRADENPDNYLTE